MSRIIELFNRHAPEYDRWYDTHAFAFDSEVAALQKVLPSRGKGLEVGVGTGRFARALGIRQGIDPSPEMAKIARRRGIRTQVAVAEALPFRERSFGYAAVITTLCFFANPRQAMAEIHRVLKPGGRVILGIIDGDSFLGRYHRTRGGTFFHRARLFNVPEAVALLEAAGFVPGCPYQTLFQSPSKLTKVDSPRRGSGEGGFCVIPGDRK